MDRQVMSKLYFKEYYVSELDFALNPQFDGESAEIEIETTVKAQIHPTENQGLVSIKMSIWDNALENNYPFKLNITIVGEFSGDQEMNREEFENMCKINGAAILFPYLRSAITDVTKIANINTLILPLVNINKLVHLNTQNR